MKPSKILMEKIAEALESISTSGKVHIMLDAGGKYVDIVVEDRQRVPLIHDKLLADLGIDRSAKVTRIYK